MAIMDMVITGMVAVTTGMATGGMRVTIIDGFEFCKNSQGGAHGKLGGLLLGVLPLLGDLSLKEILPLRHYLISSSGR
jgi:hypothetical protein